MSFPTAKGLFWVKCPQITLCYVSVPVRPIVFLYRIPEMSVSVSFLTMQK